MCLAFFCIYFKIVPLYLNIINRNLMKKLLFIPFIFMNYLVSSQIGEGEDGLYYDGNKEIYSGEYTEKFDNDSLKLKMNVLNGELDGDVEYYFENGLKKEIRAYKNGEMYGTWLTWNESGIKIAEANYKNNKKDGKWLVWDEKGIKRYEMQYENGKKVGVWYIWDENGVLINEKDFNGVK